MLSLLFEPEASKCSLMISKSQLAAELRAQQQKKNFLLFLLAHMTQLHLKILAEPRQSSLGAFRPTQFFRTRRPDDANALML